MKEHRYYVYLLTSSSRRVLYTGVARDLAKRLMQHRAGESEFTAKYKAFRLVYYEPFEWIQNAIDREKQIKGWKRQRKEELVREMNPRWEDFAPRFGLEVWPKSQAPEVVEASSGRDEM
ncbi:MAG TPA: GIY-YIG nuclease family protein [Acidobacteriaceae bacterium]|nr:GIY-YIG nuclease family protein [Acidobacteriaceae bacterium]